MKTNYTASLQRVLAHEGGYSNHPRDPGGATMKGVIQRVYDAYRQRNKLAPQSVKKITNIELQEIYRRQYWDVIRGDDLPVGVDYCVFDGAVNSGPRQSGKWLQRSLKAKVIDGNIGEVTINLAREMDAEELINHICDQRMSFLRSLDTWSTFGVGWTRRVNGVRSAALAMAKGNKLTKPQKMVADETGKALPSDTKVTETPAGNVGTKTATTGIIATISTSLDQFADKISAFSGISPEVVGGALKVIMFASLTGVVVAGGLAIYDVVRRKAKGESVEAA